jgi:hypothetical protein
MIKVCDAIMGTGKAQPLTSPVLTPDGFILMNDVTVGSSVIGEDGLPHTVVGVFPQGVKKVYRVTFTDGSHTECCDEHLWTYQLSRDVTRGIFRTRSLKEILLDDLYVIKKNGDIQYKYNIPIVKPVQFDKRELIATPSDFGKVLSMPVDYKSIEHIDDVLDALRMYKMDDAQPDELFIPVDYKLSCENDRRELLNSLVSGDTVVNHRFKYFTESKTLAKDIQFLVQSLGGIARIKVQCKNSQSGMDKLNVRYLVKIKTPDYSKGENHGTGINRAICKIEYVGNKECQCILVDSEKHLYVTDSFIVTHNTTAAINYMNAHTDDKFIFITPYLDEAKRIQDKCPALNFIEPSNQIPQYEFKKGTHTAALIKQGRNITSTHQAFKSYTKEMLREIQEQGYTLFLDECISLVETQSVKKTDIEVLLNTGLIKDVGNSYEFAVKNYDCGMLSPIKEIFGRQSVNKIDGDDGTECLFYWTLSPNLISSFKDVYILTYLFEGQGLEHYLKLNNLNYEKTNVTLRDGCLQFGNNNVYVPQYVGNLSNMIHIVDGKLNDVGDKKNNLSMAWFAKSIEGTRRLKLNLYNYFVNMHRGAEPKEKLWSTYSPYKDKLTGKGYSKAFLSFNTRATNEYRESRYLAYAVNIYMNVAEKLAYTSNGIKVDEDAYALSTMLQWIWRSAIRDGKEIELYIPSKRMRTILTNWIKNVSTNI